MLEIFFAFATVFGPAHMDPQNPNSTFACDTRRQVDTAVYAVASRRHPCGTVLRVCSDRRCVIAPVLDWGPQRARPGGPRADDLDLSVGLARALGIGDRRGQTRCRGERRGRGCPVTYTVWSAPAYRPPRS